MNNWERTTVAKKSSGWVGTVLQILTLGIAGPAERWEVIYTNKINRQVVTGEGTTEAEADARARALCV